MKMRSIALFGTSAMLGLVAVALVKGLPQSVTDPKIGTPVVVARTSMHFGDQLQAEGLQLMEFAPNSVPEGAFHSIDELTSGEARYALETIHASEAVTSAKVTGKGGKASLSSVIDQSKRAVTIRVDDVFGVAGFITPADHVDVMLTHSEIPQQTNSASKTEILLQNVKVLAIDQQANEHEDKPAVAKAVTLEVTPEEAQKLALARSVGTLSLALRNFTDPNAYKARAISIADLGEMVLPKKADPLSFPLPAHVATVDVIRGTSVTSYDSHGDVVKSADKTLH